MGLDLSVIVLTYNEERHIGRCLSQLLPLLGCQMRRHETHVGGLLPVYVVDSFSNDKTTEIAKRLGAQVFQNPWEGLYARQFNWALEHLPITTRWVLRLDADEYLYPELIDEIKAKLEALPEDVTGVAFKRRHIFLGRWMKCGTYPVTLIRLFRYGKARCEQRLMDEHIELLEGRSVTFDGDFADHNLNDIGWWTDKHNGYALREAVDLLDMEYGLLDGFNAETQRRGDAEGEEGKCRNEGMPECLNGGGSNAAGKLTLELQNSRTLELPGRLEGQAAEKRRRKIKYARLPLFWRAFAFFGYRYFLRGGFLEGKEGFLWHFLQGWWYRTLVDAKIWEITRESGGDREKMLALLRGKYGMKI